MRNKLIMGALLSSSMLSFGQKDEIKSAEKALKSNDYEAALSTLSSVDGNSADAKLKGKYYFYLGKSNMMLGAPNKESIKVDYVKSGMEAFDKLVAFEKENKAKYTDEALALKSAVADTVKNAAFASNEKKEFDVASKEFELVYRLKPIDTASYSNAAITAGIAKDYDRAIKIYNDLLEIGYDGSTVQYFATDVATNDVTPFTDKKTRDLYVKSGAYKDPEDKKTPSQRPEIIKRLALIYVEQGENDKAIAAFDQAIANEPDNVDLIMSQAFVYYEMGDNAKFKELMQRASEMAPDNAEIQFNIGVASGKLKDYEGAKAAYKRALEIKPTYKDAATNLSTTYLDEGNGVIEKMNALGNTKEDNEKFEVYAKQKEELYYNAANVLEAYLKETGTTDPKLLDFLKQIYGAVSDTENFKRIKDMLGE
ncbi:hypothetical protein NBRC110019_08580 [Neptunitalea chrysea]|uniref:Tetratricopeptide repeat-containing protein n=1 Tax=Neptunitalea chrysea TaxID=1647581 RepID=A0A9W6B3I9_9FLAO|nr:tetratricopeptide repeat protein [Neptunitalea chrysea]GLB51819.1 hypothetical protein NBRC110019_08580 [Neptunitalea chrysea]